MAKVEFNLSPDRSSLEMKGAEDVVTFEAGEVDRVIRALGGLRAAMLPALPAGEPAAGTAASTAANMTWYVRIDPAVVTQCQLWLLHPGLGWVAIPLAKAGLSQLVLALQHAQATMPDIQ